MKFVKLVIQNINAFTYYLKDENDNIYRLDFEFCSLVKKLKINDCLFVHESLLEEKCLLSFGELSSPYGRVITDINDKDLIILLIDNEKLCLKRLYG